MKTQTTDDQNDVMKRCVVACRGALIAVGFVSFFANILMLTVPLYMLQIFDRVIAARSRETLIYLTVAAVGGLLFFGLLDVLRSRILVRVSLWLEGRLGPDALGRAVSAMVQSHNYGAQSLRDISQIRQFIASPAIFALFDAPWAPIYLFVLYLFHPILGGIGIAGAVVLFSLAILNEAITRKPLKSASEQMVNAMRKTDAAMRNADAIEAMGIMPGILRRWLTDSQEALRIQGKVSDRAGLLVATSKVFRLLVQIAMLGTGAYLVLRFELTPGGMIAGSIISARALQPVEQAIGTWKSLVSARTAYNRLVVFMNDQWLRQTDIEMPWPEGHLSVEGVVFVPPGSKKPTLKGVTFAVSAGEMLAIVGPTGSGKSTLARLIVGTWRPRSGTVRLDGADVYTWERTDFGQHVGYLPQDVELFEGTIGDNISRLQEVRSKEIVEAAKLANVHDMILHMPDGYSTEIGPGGATLSGGQRQRVALARALFGCPQLIVLDEPNASLDGEGEDALLSAVKRAREEGSTIVLIGHRPSIVNSADKILFLRDGVAELFGPRDEVLEKLTGKPPGPEPIPLRPRGMEEQRRRS
jgi:PrtD family type I secretion system ABC transporter